MKKKPYFICHSHKENNSEGPIYYRLLLLMYNINKIFILWAWMCICVNDDGDNDNDDDDDDKDGDEYEEWYYMNLHYKTGIPQGPIK